ncbi:Hypothetical predicted protein [Marmota monax]|uniref:Phospholipase A2-like central domain-containing protein n=1 Tax=Marmota monax TaxID=9995 RepID=A0A5E4A1N5_MARMO|nr:Hypothetical predicted protein [Marmota monax]
MASGNLVQFGVMIERMTGKSALQYNDYGCYCGIGGSHWPVDQTDCSFGLCPSHPCPAWPGSQAPPVDHDPAGAATPMTVAMGGWRSWAVNPNWKSTFSLSASKTSSVVSGQTRSNPHVVGRGSFRLDPPPDVTFGLVRGRPWTGGMGFPIVSGVQRPVPLSPCSPGIWAREAKVHWCSPSPCLSLRNFLPTQRLLPAPASGEGAGGAQLSRTQMSWTHTPISGLSGWAGSLHFATSNALDGPSLLWSPAGEAASTETECRGAGGSEAGLPAIKPGIAWREGRAPWVWCRDGPGVLSCERTAQVSKVYQRGGTEPGQHLQGRGSSEGLVPSAVHSGEQLCKFPRSSVHHHRRKELPRNPWVGAAPLSAGSHQNGAEDEVENMNPRAAGSRPNRVPERESRASNLTGKTTCQRRTCECDRRAALCFRRYVSTYNRKYAHYPNKLCTGPTPPC